MISGANLEISAFAFGKRRPVKQALSIESGSIYFDKSYKNAEKIYQFPKIS